jgi:hypothetical protein
MRSLELALQLQLLQLRAAAAIARLAARRWRAIE